MSAGESFLARWSRLKREQTAAPEQAPPPADVPMPTVDLASLPPIESLGAGSDISAYLNAGVSLELTQAALRSAWRADPAVRKFVEIADNQWDFNTAEAIPGFGTLGVAEEARALVARAATTTQNTVATLATLEPGLARADSQVRTAMTSADSRVVDPVWQVGIVPVDRGEPTPVEAPETRPEPGASAASRRLHGSALPK